MKKLLQIIWIISLFLACGCGVKNQKPEEKFIAIFNETSNDDIFLWVTNLEEIDRLTEKTQKRHAIDHASKLKNDVPLSAYQRVGYEEEFREKTEELLENIKLKETEKFDRVRVLLRVGCEKEEKDYLVIYDDMLAKIIHIDKNLDIHEEYYEVESVSVVEDFLEYIDSLKDE